MLVGRAIGGVPAGTPFLLLEVIILDKPFMTYDQQIEKLREKHMVIEDDVLAKDILHRYGYFAVVSGYKDLLKNPTTQNYKDGTTISDLMAIYQFDDQLRELTLRYLMQVERHMRSALSYAFCSAFGEEQTAYLMPQNYDISSPRKERDVNKLIYKFLKPPVEKESQYTYIEHQKKQHQNVPLWVLVNALTFGNISNMYALSKPQVQSVISKEFPGINEYQLKQILQVLTDFRNVCAHNERLFTYRCPKYDIPNLPIHRKLQIPKNGQEYIYGKRDYFAILIALRYLIPNKEFLEYKNSCAKIIDKLNSRTDKIPRDELLHKLGFPSNWKKITVYKK